MGRFYALLALIAVVGVGAIGYVANRPQRQTPTRVDPSLARQAEGYLLGRPDAPVQVLEFADYECPGCASFATITEPDIRTRLVETGRINLRFYDFPLPQHRNSWAASHAAACAADQGKFWEMHDRIFQGQDEWNTQATSNPKSVLERYARELGLNVEQWEECYDSEKHQTRIEANMAEGVRRNVNSTPTFIIGTRMIPGAVGYDAFKAYVDSATAELAAGTRGAAADSAPPRSADTARAAADTAAR